MRLQNTVDLAEKYDILLTDLPGSNPVNLSKENYNFTSTAGTFTNRFKIQLAPANRTALDKTNSSFIYILQDGKLTLPELSGEAELIVYDINGKAVQKADHFTAGQTLRLIQTGPQILSISHNSKIERFKLINIY